MTANRPKLSLIPNTTHQRPEHVMKLLNLTYTMRIIHAKNGFDIDGLYLALSYLSELNITKYKIDTNWPGFIYLHNKSDYEKLHKTAHQK